MIATIIITLDRKCLKTLKRLSAKIQLKKYNQKIITKRKGFNTGYHSEKQIKRKF